MADGDLILGKRLIRRAKTAVRSNAQRRLHLLRGLRQQDITVRLIYEARLLHALQSGNIRYILRRKAFSVMGGTGNLQPPFLLRARDLQGNSEDVEQKQKNRHDGNGNGKTGTEAAVRAAAPQAAEGCRRGETPSEGLSSALDLRHIFRIVQQRPRRLAAVPVQGHAQRQSQRNEENRQMEQNIHRLHMKDQPREAVVADLKKRREQRFQRYDGNNHGAGRRQQEHRRKLRGKQCANLTAAGSAGAEYPNVRGKALQVTLVSGTHHRYREQNDQHIDEQKDSLPRKMGRIGGYPVGVFIAERSREQGFVARRFHALADLVLKNGHALRISPFLV